MPLLKTKRAPLVPIGNLYEKRSANDNVFFSGQLIVNRWQPMKARNARDPMKGDAQAG